MKVLDLTRIRKPYFGYEDLARVLGITPASARVAASRYARQGVLIRVRRNLYVLREAWNAGGMEQRFQLANIAQAPSYISLSTALAYYEVTTQIQRDFFESVAIKRTREIHINGTIFRYAKINPALYWGFRKERQFFIATPEKALLDAFYLMSYGRYGLDVPALDADKLDRAEIKRLISRFPLKTRSLLERYGYL